MGERRETDERRLFRSQCEQRSRDVLADVVAHAGNVSIRTTGEGEAGRRRAVRILLMQHPTVGREREQCRHLALEQLTVGASIGDTSCHLLTLRRRLDAVRVR